MFLAVFGNKLTQLCVCGFDTALLAVEFTANTEPDFLHLRLGRFCPIIHPTVTGDLFRNTLRKISSRPVFGVQLGGGLFFIELVVCSFSGVVCCGNFPRSQTIILYKFLFSEGFSLSLNSVFTVMFCLLGSNLIANSCIPCQVVRDRFLGHRVPDLTHLMRNFLLTHAVLGAGKNLPCTLRSMCLIRLIRGVISVHVVVKLGQSVQHFSNFHGLYRGEFLSEKGMHVCLGYLTGKPQCFRCSADPLTRRHTVHSVIVA